MDRQRNQQVQMLRLADVPRHAGVLAQWIWDEWHDHSRLFAPKLCVFTEKRAWYESRGWELVEAKPQSTSAVLVRATA